VKRIGFARIAQESNALSPVPTTLADFEGSHYLEGPALLRAATKGPEVPGVFRRVELAGFMQAALARKAEIEPVPLLSAWTTPGGPLTKECFETLEARFVESLRKAGPLDGLYFCQHGAMGVVGVPDPESRLLQAARSVLGGAPIVVSHDLHGNLTRARIDAADAILAYQTNPHRDHARIGRRSGEVLIGTVLGELRPTIAWRSLPMILGGGKTIDFLAPMRAVFRHMRRAEKRPGVLAASTLMVHPWNDDPGLGWSTVAVTNNDRATAERVADELAEMCWARRHAQPPAFPSASEAIADARAATLRRKLGCVTMADASDVVTAGAPGDSTHLIRALLEEGSGLLAYCAVRDPHAIERLWPEAEGARVELSIGGTLDPARSAPLPVRGVVRSKHARHGYGRTIVLEVEHLRVVITEGPALVMRPSFYTELGLSLWKADIAVVKNFFPFLMFFLPYNRKTIFVRTHGATDLDAAFQLRFDGPMHPRDVLDDWRARDRERRGVLSGPTPARPNASVTAAL